MKRAFLLLLTLFSIAFFLISIHVHVPETIQAAGSSLNVELLSDHSLTEADTFFNIYGYNIVINGSVAHLYWQETGNDTEGTDLFYRQIPGGSTIRLSDSTRTDGDVNLVWFDTAIASDGTFHMIWLEDTNTAEADDLFYWSAASGTVLLSDRTETEGYVQPAFSTMQLILDTKNTPQTFWYEETGTAEEQDLFYWNPTIGTVLLTDRFQTEGSDFKFGPNKLEIDDNDMPHITWAEYGNDGITAAYFYWNSSLSNPINMPYISASIVVEDTAYLFDWSNSEGPISYWNSTTQTTQTIPSSSDPGGYIFARGPIVDSTNTIHLFWSEDNSSICLSHWNSNTQTTEDLVTGEQCFPPWLIYLSPDDTLHTIVIDEPMGNRRNRYWNNSLSDPIVLPMGQNITNAKMTSLPGTNAMHLTWIETVGSDDNFYHWDNVNQIASNLSQLAGSDTHISSFGQYVKDSNNGELYMLWQETTNGLGVSQNLYWDSATNSTQNLFTKLGIDSVTTSLEAMRMDLLSNGSPYTMWHGSPVSGPEGLYLWNSANDMVYLAGESLPCSYIGPSYKNDSDIFGNIYLSWQDDATRSNYFWSANSGQINLSQTAAAESTCNPPVLAASENGDVYVMWIEESDTAGEGLDIFVGWIQAPTSNIYLPMVTK